MNREKIKKKKVESFLGEKKYGGKDMHFLFSSHLHYNIINHILLFITINIQLC